MTETKGYTITMTKGDSAFIKLNFKNEDGSDYTLSDDETIRIQVRDEIDDGTLCFEGDIRMDADENIIWYIRPEDTRKLESDMYYWDAQIENTRDVYTLMPPRVKGVLRVEGEVTR